MHEQSLLVEVDRLKVRSVFYYTLSAAQLSLKPLLLVFVFQVHVYHLVIMRFQRCLVSKGGQSSYNFEK